MGGYPHARATPRLASRNNRDKRAISRMAAAANAGHIRRRYTARRCSARCSRRHSSSTPARTPWDWTASFRRCRIRRQSTSRPDSGTRGSCPSVRARLPDADAATTPAAKVTPRTNRLTAGFIPGRYESRSRRAPNEALRSTDRGAPRESRRCRQSRTSPRFRSNFRDCEGPKTASEPTRVFQS